MMRRAFRSAALAAAILLAACTPQGPSVVDSEVPQRAWVPDAPPRAVILALHGFNDYSAAFEQFGTYAARRGVAVYAYDQRGFGANADAGFWPGMATLTADLRGQVDHLAASYPDTPLYVLGESMGAAVIIAATAQAPLDVDGRILVAPAVWGADQLNPFYRATLWVSLRVAPGWKLTGKGLDVLPSDNLEMLRALSRDPNVIKQTRIDAIGGLVTLMDTAVERTSALNGPLLVLGGARDEVVPPQAHAAVVQRLEAEPCEEVVYPDGYHMLLRDMQRETVWEDVMAWIEDEPLPSGLAAPCGAPKPVDASFG